MNEYARSPVGRRVAELRRLRGLTQVGLAYRLHRSESWVTKVERGERRLDSVAVLHELAEALAVPVGLLTGQDGTAPAGVTQAGVAALSELRRSLDRPVVTSPRPTELRPVGEVVAEVRGLRRRYDTARNNVSVVLPSLPDLLGEAHRLAYAAPVADQPRAYAALVSLYRLAAMAFYCWGDLVRARVAVDRGSTAAEHAGDPMLIGAAGVFTTQVMWHTDPGAALVTAGAVIDLLSGDSRAKSAMGIAVLGSLHGFAAKAAARAGDKAEAQCHMAAAVRMADALGRDSTPYGVFCGPTYSSLYRTMILVELDHPRAAARVGETTPAHKLASVPRGGYHLVYLAQAYSVLGQDDEALAAVEAGLRMAPELLRDHGIAGGISRTVVSRMLHRRRHVGDDLRRVARYLDLP